ncbi:hypothetical protein QTO34_017234 [Cnephaeus nilssonii]|uniref:Uncharacterized protein n=1 Tax=Cnephaeus nilssonii TaxID=3371016 RepID=A0AA40I0L9_CNENI|nr:hypothetical protein QTO34_017234 [Eptesicus nilssonii]
MRNLKPKNSRSPTVRKSHSGEKEDRREQIIILEVELLSRSSLPAKAAFLLSLSAEMEQEFSDLDVF